MNANLRKVNIKENGHKIKLPDDDFARLMYYLDLYLLSLNTMVFLDIQI